MMKLENIKELEKYVKAGRPDVCEVKNFAVLSLISEIYRLKNGMCRICKCTMYHREGCQCENDE